MVSLQVLKYNKLIILALPDDSYAKVSKLINKRLKHYDKNVRPNDTGNEIILFMQSHNKNLKHSYPKVLVALASLFLGTVIHGNYNV